MDLRGFNVAAQALREYKWQLQTSDVWVNDHFSVLRAEASLESYERARSYADSAIHLAAFEQIATTLAELGETVRYIGISLDLKPKPPAADPRALSRREVDKLVTKYIGVDGGYLGDFTYRTHAEFYANLNLEVDLVKFTGTTREKFIAVLSTSPPLVQGKILQGVLDKYPVGSTAIRTEQIGEEILGWIRRLDGVQMVSLTDLRTTTSLVERALQDAEKLVKATGARVESIVSTQLCMVT